MDQTQVAGLIYSWSSCQNCNVPGFFQKDDIETLAIHVNIATKGVEQKRLQPTGPPSTQISSMPTLDSTRTQRIPAGPRDIYCKASRQYLLLKKENEQNHLRLNKVYKHRRTRQ